MVPRKQPKKPRRKPALASEEIDQLSGHPVAHAILDQFQQAYFTFKPRPDQPERFDQQTGFVESKSTGVAWLIGGNGAGTTSCAMNKLAKFVLSTPPPRKDTPFWVISNSYDMSMGICWKEKLHGQGHLPVADIDWDRIQWYRPNLDLPYIVPLKPWAGYGDRCWALEFKSYEQGRSLFQGRSIGGFCFVEQFPYALLVEVLRGCREYNFPGSKFCEFTPVDPALTVELETLIDEGKINEQTDIFRANTYCALEAGHIERSWFEDFFGVHVGEEMLETRTTGKLPHYEGTIYKTFEPLVHVREDFGPPFPENCYHARGIDWGFTKEHPFAVVWAYRDGTGDWWIYDCILDPRAGILLSDHMDEIKTRWPAPPGARTWGRTWADPSRVDLINEFNVNGIETHPASNNVHRGIECLQAKFKHQPQNGVPGIRPRLFIHKRCKALVNQLKAYRWLKSSGKGINPAAARKEPLKKDDDLPDALRYLVYSEQQFSGLQPSSMSTSRERPRRWGIQQAGR